MNRFWTLAAICGAILAIILAGGFALSGPVFAQNVKPPQDVRVVNAANSPVPVAVQSLPAVQAPEPVSVSEEITLSAGVLGDLSMIYTVPADKRLVIEFVSFRSTVVGDEEHRITITAAQDGVTQVAGGHFGPESSLSRTQMSSEMTQIFVGPGQTVQVFVGRTSPTNTVGATSTNVRFPGISIPSLRRKVTIPAGSRYR